MCYVWLAGMVYFGFNDSIISMFVLNASFVLLFRWYQFFLQFIHFVWRLLDDVYRQEQVTKMTEIFMFHVALRPAYDEYNSFSEK